MEEEGRGARCEAHRQEIAQAARAPRLDRVPPPPSPLHFFFFSFLPWGGGRGEEEKKGGPPNMLSFLTESQKDVVKSIEEKIAKIGFETNVRFIYVDRRDSFTRANVSAVNGAFRQFNTQNLNGFRPDMATFPRIASPFALFKERRERGRKTMLFFNYRTLTMNQKVSVLNIEGRAPIPPPRMGAGGAPMPRRLESRKGDPPPALPTE